MLKRFDSVLPAIVKCLFLISWIFLFIGGIIHYHGSLVTYAVFSVVFFALMLSGFYRQMSYGYLFLVVMLWLGFWVKFTIFLLLKYPFEEPVGFFIGSPASWDEVLHIASIGGFGVLIGRVLYGMLNKSSTMVISPGTFQAPEWYIAIRRRAWTVLVLTCLGLAFINTSLGIEQIGLAPRTVLWWHLGALVSWLVTTGVAIFVSTLLWWDVALGRNISLVVYFILFEAFMGTFTLLSRGIAVFHVLPQFFAMFKNRKNIKSWSWITTLSLGGSFIALLMFSFPVVNLLRDHYYNLPLTPPPPNHPTQGQSVKIIIGKGHKPFFRKAYQKLQELPRFAVYRWMGLEGLMAVSAYPQKSGHLLLRGLTEHRKVGKNTLYQEICQSGYRFMDTTKYEFASLPGAIGFFYFSGSLWVVASGMSILAIIILFSERLILKFTENPFLSALCAGIISSALVQIGVDVVGLVIYFLEMSCGIAAIWFIQSKYFSMIWQRFGFLRQ